MRPGRLSLALALPLLPDDAQRYEQAAQGLDAALFPAP